MKKLTESQLIQRRWWWRHSNTIFTLNPKKHTSKAAPLTPSGWKIGGKPVLIEWPFWKDGVEWAAYAYEMARRANVQSAKLPPWPELNADELQFIRGLFGKGNLLWVSSTAPQKGYSDSIRWNLALTNGALRTAFLDWIVGNVPSVVENAVGGLAAERTSSAVKETNQNHQTHEATKAQFAGGSQHQIV